MSTIGLFQWMNEIWQLVPEREDIRMSQQKDLLREIAAASSSGSPDRISDWFTEDFRLHEPGTPALPVEHEEAREMRQAVR